MNLPTDSTKLRSARLRRGPSESSQAPKWTSPNRDSLANWTRIFDLLVLYRSAEFLDYLLDRAFRLDQIVDYHDRVKLNARIESEHPRFRD